MLDKEVCSDETVDCWPWQHGQTPRPAGKGHGCRHPDRRCGYQPGPPEEACRLGLADAAYSSIGEAVAAFTPDAALVCTAPLSHAVVIGELLDHRLPVFTELNLVEDGYDQNLAKAAEQGVPLFLSSTMLYRREIQYIKEQVRQFGKPVHYIYHIGQYLPTGTPGRTTRTFSWQRRTGGVREILASTCPGCWTPSARWRT